MRRGRHGRRSTGGQSGSPAQRHCMLLLTPHLLFQVAAHITCASAEARADAELQAAALARAVQSRTLKPAAIKV